MAIALHEPTFDAKDEAALLEALRSSWVSTGGPFIDRFELGVADFVGAKYAVATANGTLGLVLALDVIRRQHKISGRFEVIVPTLSFAATANAVLSAGGSPILADAADGSMNLNVDDIDVIVREFYAFDPSQKRWINKKSHLPLLAIMPAHLMGYGCDIVKLAAICDELKIVLIEDAAEALGVRAHSGQHLGTFGKAGIFSFNGNKILTTGGGGMIVTNDEEFAKRAKHISTTAKTDGLRFIHDELGYNFRLVNLLAALGCSQLTKLEERLEAKETIFKSYQELLKGYNEAKLYSQKEFISNHWIINLVFNTFNLREKALSALLTKNIQARPLWTPAHRLPHLRDYGFCTSYRNADWIWERSLSVPSSGHLTTADIRLICETIRTATEEK